MLYDYCYKISYGISNSLPFSLPRGLCIGLAYRTRERHIVRDDDVIAEKSSHLLVDERERSVIATDSLNRRLETEEALLSDDSGNLSGESRGFL